MKQLKLRNLIEGFGSAQQQQQSPEQPKKWTTEEKKAALAKIGEYAQCGQHLYRQHNLMEIAHKLAEITKCAEELALYETNNSGADQAWFDAQTVKKNFASLNKISEEFQRHAKEAHALQQRIESLYEDAAHVISRYYEINDLKEGAMAVSKIVKK